jgi:hypothetical protein
MTLHFHKLGSWLRGRLLQCGCFFLCPLCHLHPPATTSSFSMLTIRRLHLGALRC